MKKLSIVICVIAMFFCLSLTTFAAYLGDVNGDGAVNASDARTILRVSAKLDAIDDSRAVFADVNGDGAINASDARTVLRMSAKLDKLQEMPSDASKEEILKKYTEVMNNLKSGVATYDKKEYQRISDDYDLGTVGNLVLPIAQNIMISEDEAEIQHRDDMGQIPVINNTKGCLLTDVSKIKAAHMTERDGKTTIVIVLHDEVNPLPATEGATSCDSAVGSMFNPLSQKEIDNIVAEFSGVVTMNKFQLTAKDCTATLVFDTYTGEVLSLEQIMNYFIEVDAKAVIVPISGYATVINKLVINNITYNDYVPEASKEEILNKYTEVMNNLKSGVATYDKKEFQVISDDYDFGTVGNLIIPIAQNIISSEDEAEIQHRDDMEQIPIIRNRKGCLLTDVSKIKTAHMTEHDGKTTIVIVLHDEVNPLPAAEGATSCDSAVGSMFNPLSPQEINSIADRFAMVVTINKFRLTAKDCTATLVFDTATGEVELLEQKMHFYIEADMNAVIVPVTGYATITNSMTINNITYK